MEWREQFLIVWCFKDHSVTLRSFVEDSTSSYVFCAMWAALSLKEFPAVLPFNKKMHQDWEEKACSLHVEPHTPLLHRSPLPLCSPAPRFTRQLPLSLPCWERVLTNGPSGTYPGEWKWHTGPCTSSVWQSNTTGKPRAPAVLGQRCWQQAPLLLGPWLLLTPESGTEHPWQKVRGTCFPWALRNPL